MRRAALFALLVALVLVPLAAARTQALALDAGFGTGGRVQDAVATHSEAYAVARGPGSRLVAAGFAGSSSSSYDIGLARYLATGQLDTSFNGTGHQTIHIVGGGATQSAYAVLTTPTHKTVVAGTDGAGHFAVARLLVSGAPDPSFSGDGQTTTSFAVGSATAFAVARAPSGRIVVAGGAGTRFAVARYTKLGAPDPAFGTNGKVTVSFGAGLQGAAAAVFVQPDGKIVVAGTVHGSSGGDFALARLLPHGQLDSSFGTGGKVVTDFGASSNDLLYGALLQPDGKIVACGESSPALAVARYLPNGSLDAGFGAGGKATISSSDELRAGDCTLDSAGNILAGGTRFGGTPSTKQFIVAGVTPAGQPNLAFGPTGFGGADFGDGITEAEAMLVQPNGRIVVAGHHGPSTVSETFALMRFRLS